MSYITLDNFKVYQLAKEYSKEARKVYETLGWQIKKIIGDQFVRSVDSVGANIAEGYGRYHYLDKIKFYYISRGSLLESKHWLDLLFERKIINQEIYNQIIKLYNNIKPALNALISSNYKSKNF